MFLFSVFCYIECCVKCFYFSVEKNVSIFEMIHDSIQPVPGTRQQVLAFVFSVSPLSIQQASVVYGVWCIIATDRPHPCVPRVPMYSTTGNQHQQQQPQQQQQETVASCPRMCPRMHHDQYTTAQLYYSSSKQLKSSAWNEQKISSLVLFSSIAVIDYTKSIYLIPGIK